MHDLQEELKLRWTNMFTSLADGGDDIAADFGDNWQDFYPFPQIPAMGKRAPVYPSTPE